METSNLILRRWKENECDILYNIAKDNRVAEPCGFKPFPNVEFAKDVITKWLQPGKEDFAIVCKKTNEIVGNIQLMTNSNSQAKIGDGEGEISYFLGYKYWGNGYATEALKEMIR